MKFKMKVPMEENARFASDATVDCIGKHVHKNGMIVGTIINYEIVDRELIIECETNDSIIIGEIERGVIQNITIGLVKYPQPFLSSDEVIARHPKEH
jgi:hypothetical protein